MPDRWQKGALPIVHQLCFEQITKIMAYNEDMQQIREVHVHFYDCIKGQLHPVQLCVPSKANV